MNQTTLFPKKILIGIQEGSCNLQCPKCYTHGTNYLSSNTRPKGIMDFEKFKIILDEAKKFNPRIGPQTWDEPFINPRLLEYLEEIKKRDLSITMDTNGLLMNREHMKQLIEIKADSVFISVDAFYPETYKLVRGTNKLEELKEIIHEFLLLRGDRLYPRIGVSYVAEETNAQEVDAFVDYWTQLVDVVRVNEIFQDHRTLSNKPKTTRTPCWSLTDTLMIHNNGEAALCCVDTHYENKIGNVFEQGLLGVWNGSFFNKTRLAHDKGDFQSASICAKCDLWSHEEPKNSKTESLLISETNTHKYFNRLDRLENVIKSNRFI
jgi:MoaA/NifB/PqqE/SkfB family radical SAM enzyme